MAQRVAFFAQKQEIEKYYSIETDKESLFEAHYNLSPGHQLPVITADNDKTKISRIRWGLRKENKTEQTTLKKENVLAELASEKAERCILPLSGFFIWKESREKNHPFFVRLLTSPVMSVAGIYFRDSDEFVSIITTGSNALIQPMSERMPLLLDQPHALKWLDKHVDAKNLLEQTENLFLLTDLTVLRVSKKVNDPSNNNAELIQPIPK